MIYILTSEELRAKLEALYPIDATCWSKATGEVRDLCRYARYALDLEEEHAVDFRRLMTPSTWNLVGIDGIINFYDLMTGQQKIEYIKSYAHLWGDREPE